MVLAVLPLPVPTIIIKRLEYEFQQLSFVATFSHLFQYSSTTNTLQLTIDNILTLMTKAFPIDEETTWPNG